MSFDTFLWPPHRLGHDDVLLLGALKVHHRGKEQQTQGSVQEGRLEAAEEMRGHELCRTWLS